MQAPLGPITLTGKPLVIADVYELAGRLRRNADRLTAPLGQSQARWQVLSAASGGKHTVPQLARRLGVARQNVQRVADLLVGERLAAFEDNPDHKTSPYLVLTEAGRATLQQLMDNARTYYRELASSLSNDDLASLRASLRTFLRALDRRENTTSQGDASHAR